LRSDAHRITLEIRISPAPAQSQRVRNRHAQPGMAANFSFLHSAGIASPIST
jgi:hypothetical protein